MRRPWWLATPLALAVALAPEPAHADFVDDAIKGRPTTFCPLLAGAGCLSALSVDPVMGYQLSRSANGTEESFRGGLEVGLHGRVARDLMVGAVFEHGGADGPVTTSTYGMPKVRLTYWIAGSPASLSLTLGATFARTWLDAQRPGGGGAAGGHNLLGPRAELAVGVLGVLSAFVAGDALADPVGPFGDELRLSVGARLSIFAIAAGLGAAGRAPVLPRLR
jgi:hypothetical protein